MLEKIELRSRQRKKFWTLFKMGVCEDIRYFPDIIISILFIRFPPVVILIILSPFHEVKSSENHVSLVDFFLLSHYFDRPLL